MGHFSVSILFMCENAFIQYSIFRKLLWIYSSTPLGFYISTTRDGSIPEFLDTPDTYFKPSILDIRYLIFDTFSQCHSVY